MNDGERIAILETEMKAVRGQLGMVTKAVWGVCGGIGLLVLSRLLDRFWPTMGAVVLHFAAEPAVVLWELIVR